MSRQPLDLQALAAEARKKQEEESKPKFLSAAQRAEQKAALALARRAQEVEARLAAPPRLNPDYDPRSIPAHHNHFVQPARKKRRPNDPRKIVFDWDGSDDTTGSEQHPLYAKQQPARLFGRGTMGGLADSAAEVSEDYARAIHERAPEQAAELLAFEQKQARRRHWDDRHWSEKTLKEMQERDWRIFKEDFSIQTKGSAIPQPIRNWQEAAFPEPVMKVISNIGYEQPTPIQRATIPIGLQGRDIIGIAETGSGKTASFVLPMLVYIESLPKADPQRRNDGPYAVVLAPTRELAQQIETETRKFAASLNLNVVSIVGGRSIEEQSFNLSTGCEIVIATPGRLLDCLERHVLVLSQCTYIVMDEADRMVDLGFEEAVNQILDALPVHNMKPDSDEAEDPSRMTAMIGGKERYRQTVMFSATMPPAVEKLARKYLRRPATVIIGNAGQVVESVEQRIEMCTGDERRKKRLEQVLSSGEFDRPVIVFVNTKKLCDYVSRICNDCGWQAVSLHGGKSQDQREAALAKLRAGHADVLVATDLAGRGIDVPGVTLVVNFGMSKTIEDYVHRIGRTGRAGRKGVALTLIGEEDADLFYALKGVAKHASNLPLPIRQAVKPSLMRSADP
jgi:ATP-dependent RNA helicase DDX23/PRP28